MAHLPGGKHRGFLGIGKWRIWYRVRRHFLAFRGSRPGLFCNLSAGEFCPLRILDFVELRFPPLISREKDEGLPPGIAEKAPASISVSDKQTLNQNSGGIDQLKSAFQNPKCCNPHSFLTASLASFSISSAI
jgi:hypothetical protein